MVTEICTSEECLQNRHRENEYHVYEKRIVLSHGGRVDQYI